MSRILYFDCFSGASGDMVLGALIDGGLPLDELRRALGSLAIDAASVSTKRVLRAGVSATKFIVEDREPHHHGHEERSGAGLRGPASEATIVSGAGAPTARTLRGGVAEQGSPRAREEAHSHDHHQGREHGATAVAHKHGHRSLAEINKLIDRSALSSAAQDRAKALFRRLGEVEAAIHQIPIEKIHLHEVGELDSIIDIVGAVFALEWFKADRIVSSPLNVGGGMVDSAHGRFPVPAPATVKLLEGVPVYSSGVQSELVTPTGALLVAGYASSFGPVPAMTVERVGYGAGDRDLPSTPNVLRVLVGRSDEGGSAERIVVLECEIDDMNPQLFGSVMDRLYTAGALDVYFSAVQMKKNRPGTLLTILARPEQREELTAIVFRETTTIGVRYHEVTRERLDRETIIIETALGSVRFKIARLGGQVVNASPEFEDCLRIASDHGIPVKDVQAGATRAYLDSRDKR